MYCSKSNQSTVLYSKHNLSLLIKLVSATFAIEKHYCPLQEACGIVLHIQDDVKEDARNHYGVSSVSVPELLPSLHTLSLSHR